MKASSWHTTGPHIPFGRGGWESNDVERIVSARLRGFAITFGAMSREKIKAQEEQLRDLRESVNFTAHKAHIAYAMARQNDEALRSIDKKADKIGRAKMLAKVKKTTKGKGK